MNKKLLNLLAILSLSVGVNFTIINNEAQCAQETAQQDIYAVLPEILEISKIIVDGTEHERDVPLTGVDKNGTTSVNANLSEIQLTPMQVKIHTNLATPITVTAEFLELKHIEGKYDFDVSDISFSPSSLTISNPYDEVISDDFVPKMNVRTEAATGIYTGQVRFSISAI